MYTFLLYFLLYILLRMVIKDPEEGYLAPAARRKETIPIVINIYCGVMQRRERMEVKHIPTQLI